MKKLLTILFLVCFVALSGLAQQDAASIKKKMSDIRKSTNWEDAAAAKKANEQIRELSKLLMMKGSPPSGLPQNLSKSETEAAKKDAVDEKMTMFGQIMKIAREGGDWDLAEPLREEIVQEYKDDEDPTIKNPEWFQSMSYLLINLSLPHVQVIIDQMPLYKGIKTLIITSDKPVSGVNLSSILKNAEEYPLEELYIINLGSALQKLPPEISNFTKLKTLAVYNNKLSELPLSFSKLTELVSLQLQNNPVLSILPMVNSYRNLKELGLVLTQITESEIAQIHKTLPECKITRQ